MISSMPEAACHAAWGDPEQPEAGMRTWSHSVPRPRSSYPGLLPPRQGSLHASSSPYGLTQPAHNATWAGGELECTDCPQPLLPFPKLQRTYACQPHKADSDVATISSTGANTLVACTQQACACAAPPAPARSCTPSTVRRELSFYGPHPCIKQEPAGHSQAGGCGGGGCESGSGSGTGSHGGTGVVKVEAPELGEPEQGTLAGSSKLITQAVLLKAICRPGAADRDLCEVASFWRPWGRGTRCAQLQHLTPRHHDILYALAGCVDVKEKIAQVSQKMRDALYSLYGLEKADLQLWFKNRVRRWRPRQCDLKLEASAAVKKQRRSPARAPSRAKARAAASKKGRHGAASAPPPLCIKREGGEGSDLTLTRPSSPFDGADSAVFDCSSAAADNDTYGVAATVSAHGGDAVAAVAAAPFAVPLGQLAEVADGSFSAYPGPDGGSGAFVGAAATAAEEDELLGPLYGRRPRACLGLAPGRGQASPVALHFARAASLPPVLLPGIGSAFASSAQAVPAPHHGTGPANVAAAAAPASPVPRSCFMVHLANVARASSCSGACSAPLLGQHQMPPPLQLGPEAAAAGPWPLGYSGFGSAAWPGQDSSKRQAYPIEPLAAPGFAFLSAPDIGLCANTNRAAQPPAVPAPQPSLWQQQQQQQQQQQDLCTIWANAMPQQQRRQQRQQLQLCETWVHPMQQKEQCQQPQQQQQQQQQLCNARAYALQQRLHPQQPQQHLQQQMPGELWVQQLQQDFDELDVQLAWDAINHMEEDVAAVNGLSAA